MPRRKVPDKLIVQVAFTIKRPRGYKITKTLLDKLLLLVERRGPEALPRNVQFHGIFWRNPNRRGDAGNWRTHDGADLSHAPGPLAHPARRGSLHDAFDTLNWGSLEVHFSTGV